MACRHTTNTYQRLYFWIFHFYESAHYVRKREKKIPTGNLNQFRKKRKYINWALTAKKGTDVNRNVMHRFLSVMRSQQTVFLSLSVWLNCCTEPSCCFISFWVDMTKCGMFVAECSRCVSPLIAASQSETGGRRFCLSLLSVRSSIMHCVLIV